MTWSSELDDNSNLLLLILIQMYTYIVNYIIYTIQYMHFH